MFVSVIKDNKSKKEFVVIRESFRNINGSPTARNLENFGFFNTEEEKQALIKKANEKIEILKQEKEQKNSQLPVNFALQNSNANIDENLGYRILERIYEKFEFKDFFDKTINANKKEGAFDINEVVKLLVYSRILKPDSKFETFSCKQTFFGDIFRNVKLDNLYDTLDDLSDHNSEIQTHTNNKIKELYDRELTLVFYDATNYYFEIDRNDGYDEDGNPLGLRYEGACKEHKPTPIVQMGLLMDKYRVPIAYKVFPGNTHDQNTLIPTIENFQKTLGIQKITLVADKGLNSGKNLNYLIDNGHKFIVSQMVRTIDKKFREKILESDGYKWIEPEVFKCKEFKWTRTNVDKETNEKKDYEFRVISYWSKKFDEREKMKRGVLKEDLENFEKHPGKYKTSNNFGKKKYVKEIVANSETGEVDSKWKNNISIDWDKYNRDVEMDGYYAIITNDFASPISKIIEEYKQLVKIEECFRITKSDLQGRPVYVYKPKRIDGHFMICFLALTFIRLIQKEIKWIYSAEVIQKALNSANCRDVGGKIYTLSKQTNEFKILCEHYNVNFDYTWAKYETLMKT